MNQRLKVLIQPVGLLNQLLNAMIQAAMILIQTGKNVNRRPKDLIQPLKRLNQVLKKLIQRMKIAKKTRAAQLKFYNNLNGLWNRIEFEHPLENHIDSDGPPRNVRLAKLRPPMIVFDARRCAWLASAASPAML